MKIYAHTAEAAVQQQREEGGTLRKATVDVAATAVQEGAVARGSRGRGRVS